MIDLPGHTEWVFNPNIPMETIERNVADLEAIYIRETGLIPERSRPRSIGETFDAGFDPEQFGIFVYNDVAPAFQLGYLTEELLHYQQVRDAGYLGMTLEEIDAIRPGFAANMERDVIERVRQCGFIPYDYRHYEPYTEVPRPQGVHGDDT